MKIPVRAVFSRSERGEADGFVPVMTGAVYADVPQEVIFGAMAETARQNAQGAGDTEAAEIIGRAMTRAEADGVITRMD